VGQGWPGFMVVHCQAATNQGHPLGPRGDRERGVECRQRVPLGTASSKAAASYTVNRCRRASCIGGGAERFVVPLIGGG
jgi:hypothetical protein